MELHGVKEFGFSLPESTYVADAVVLICFDERFDAVAGDSLLRAYLKFRGIAHPDIIKRPGGAHALAMKDGLSLDQPARVVLDQIDISIRLHQSRRAILFMHQDCGSLGGSAAYPDAGAERRALLESLRRAAAVVRRAFPRLPVELKLATFDGVYDVGG